MKCLILLALAAVAQAAPQYFNSIAIPTVLSDSHFVDTPEITLAKIAHLAEHARVFPTAHAAIAAAPTDIVPTSRIIAAAPADIVATSRTIAAAPAVATSSYSGPIALPTVLPHLEDIPEVAAAKISHLSEHGFALANDPARIAAAPDVIAATPVVSQTAVSSPFVRSIYSGPIAIPTVLPSGHLADTPEVSAAKALHHNAHALSV